MLLIYRIGGSKMYGRRQVHIKKEELNPFSLLSQSKFHGEEVI
jgi:hypothetical protein